MQITSKHNPRIKAIRNLKMRKQRQRTGLFLVEGIHHVLAAIEAAPSIETLLICPALMRSPRLQEAVHRAQCPIIEASPSVFETVSARPDSGGVIAVLRQQPTALDEVDLYTEPLWIALAGVQYPGNLGTILRTGDAVGTSGVILLDGCTDPYAPEAVRASLSGLFTQRIVRTDVATFSRWVGATGCPVIGGTGDASVPYRSLDYPSPLVLLMGSEGQGLLPEHRDLCDTCVSIPTCGKNDSLNLAIATSIILYEILAQHEKMPG